METVALQPGLTKVARQRYQLRNRRMAAMKAGIEAGNLRHVRQPLGNRFNGRQIIGLVQWSQRNQLMQFRQNLPAHNGGLGVPRSAMNDAVPDTQDS